MNTCEKLSVVSTTENNYEEILTENHKEYLFEQLYTLDKIQLWVPRECWIPVPTLE